MDRNIGLLLLVIGGIGLVGLALYGLFRLALRLFRPEDWRIGRPAPRWAWVTLGLGLAGFYAWIFLHDGGGGAATEDASYPCRTVEQGYAFVADRDLLVSASGFADPANARSNPKLARALDDGRLVYFLANKRGRCVDGDGAVLFTVQGYPFPYWTRPAAVRPTAR